MGQCYRLKALAMTAIPVPHHVASSDLRRFLDIASCGRGHAETRRTSKATEPSFRAGLSAGCDIVRQSEILSFWVLDVAGLSLSAIKVLVLRVISPEMILRAALRDGTFNWPIRSRLTTSSFGAPPATRHRSEFANRCATKACFP